MYVPWPVYAFGAGLAGALVGGLLAAVVLYLRYRWNWQRFDKPPGGGSPVGAAYQGGLASAFDTHRQSIAKAWAVGLLADDAAMAVALILGGAMAFVVAFDFLGLLNAGTASVAGWWSELAAVIGLAGILMVGGFVALLRDAYSDTAKRKTIGALWDVATFSPPAVHPFAPPCYGERAVPESSTGSAFSPVSCLARASGLPSRATGPAACQPGQCSAWARAADRLQSGFDHCARGRRAAAPGGARTSGLADPRMSRAPPLRARLPRLLRPGPAVRPHRAARRQRADRTVEEPRSPQRLHRIMGLQVS